MNEPAEDFGVCRVLPWQPDEILLLPHKDRANCPTTPKTPARARADQLVNHTNGLDADGMMPEACGDAAVSVYIEALRQRGVLFPPGSFLHYTNPGMSVAGRIVEVLSGKSYHRALEEEIFAPIGMLRSCTSPKQAIRHRTALGSHPDAATGTARRAPIFMLPESAAKSVTRRKQEISMQVEQLEPPMSATLGATKYFEIQSEHVGARFAVWVTLPLRYAREPDSRYPAVYQPDGNVWAPMSAPLHPLLRYDPINPIVSFIQVSVGYVGEDVARALAVRARDLLPPGEPLAAGTNRSMMDGLVEVGVLDKTGADLYWHNLHNPAADRFLAFLSDELHPWIASEYRVDESATGLFGYSYGGLFATYAALRRTRFRRIGAGSPGIVSRTSKVFEAYEAELAAGADHSGRMLHMTVCERELTVPSFYQVGVGGGTVEFMTLAGMRPLAGLTFSAHIAPLESHASGAVPSWFSFLRACYAASGSTELLKAP